MEKWATRRLKELCEVTSSKRIYAKELVSSGVPFLKSKEIIEKVKGQETHSNPLFISEERYRRIVAESGDLNTGDLLLTSRGTLGVPYIVKATDRFHFADGNLTWFRKFTELDSQYLKFFFLSDAGRAELGKCVIGSSQQAYTIAALREISISLPPLPVQRCISSTLSAYDDLIENNTRRIEILEEMARRLYEEWFVHFRFPGHEAVSFKESELGRIPEEWEIANLEEVVDLTMGQSPKSEFYNNTGEGLPFHQGVTDFGNYFPSNRLYCTVENRIAEEGDILFSVRAPVGRINISKEKIVIGRGVSALRSKTVHQAFLLSQLRKIFEEEDSIGNGAIFNAVTKKDMQTIKLLQPDSRCIDRFESIASSLWKQIRVLSDKNINLRAQRDLLLTKLVSGEIDVSKLPLPDNKEAEAA